MGSFAQRLRDAMQSAGLKAVDLHERTGISKASISEYLSGNYEPKQKNVYRLAEARHVAPRYLMGLSEQEPPRIPRPAPPAPQKSDGLPELNARDERDIQKRLKSMLDDLDPNAGLAYYNGQEPMDDETRDLIRAALENSLRVAKQIAKAKYTPKKYRKADDTAARIGKKILDASPSAQIAVSQIIDKDKSDTPKDEK